MSRDPLKGPGNRGPDGTAGLIREGMLDRLLRKLVRPRVELPLERVQVTQAGDMELHWAPLRMRFSYYDVAANTLKIQVTGGRVMLSGGPSQVPDTVVDIVAPSVGGATFWVYVDKDGSLKSATIEPGAGAVQCGAVIGPSTWPATAPLVGFVSEYGELHGIGNQTIGDCWVALADRTTYRWDGSTWTAFLTIADKRTWFAPIGTWREPVTAVADLPTTGNRDGDARVVKDEDRIYLWDAPSSTWKAVSGGPPPAPVPEWRLVSHPEPLLVNLIFVPVTP